MSELVGHLIALWLLLAGLHGPAPAAPVAPAVYVPSPLNRFVPKPSCATLVDPRDKRAPWRYLAACATTHGLVVHGPYSARRTADRVADTVAEAELAAQGGQLRP